MTAKKSTKPSKLLEHATPEHTIAEGRASIYAAERVWRHARYEFEASLETIMMTIASDVDLVYAVNDGKPDSNLIIATTPEQAYGHYSWLYENYHVTNWQPFVEIRTPWYVFFNGVDTILNRATGQTHQGESLVLFTLCEQEGILGEIALARNPGLEHYERTLTPTGTANAAALNRVANLALHERYLKAMRNADIDGLLATMTENPNIALRNFLKNNQKDYIGLLSREEITKHYTQFFKKYRVDSIEPIRNVIGDWYIFTELHWAVTDIKNGNRYGWHTVEFCPIEGKGLIRCRVGYGSEAVQIK